MAVTLLTRREFLMAGAAAVAAQQLGGCRKSYDSVTEQTFLSGSVNDVLTGFGRRARNIGTNQVLFGIGAGSVDGTHESMGETIVVAGRAFVKPTGEKFKRGGIETSSSHLLTPFLVGMSPEATAEKVEEVTNPENRDFGSVIVGLPSYRPTGIAYMGIIAFRQLNSVAIKLPPIDTEHPLLKNRELYWADPAVTNDRLAIVCGLAVDNLHNNPDIFYRNPNDATNFQIHTHVLMVGKPGEGTKIFSSLNNRPANRNLVEAIRRLITKYSGSLDVGHLLNQSVVERARLAIYPLSS